MLKRSDLLTQQNSEGRPWIAVLASAAVVLALGLFVPNKGLLMSLCASGVISSLVIAIVSLFVIQVRQKRYRGMPITALAFVIAMGLLRSQLLNSGNTLLERLYTLSPLAVFLILGATLMQPQGTCPKGSDKVDELLESGDHGPLAP